MLWLHQPRKRLLIILEAQAQPAVAHRHLTRTEIQYSSGKKIKKKSEKKRTLTDGLISDP